MLIASNFGLLFLDWHSLFPHDVLLISIITLIGLCCDCPFVRFCVSKKFKFYEDKDYTFTYSFIILILYWKTLIFTNFRKFIQLCWCDTFLHIKWYEVLMMSKRCFILSLTTELKCNNKSFILWVSILF